MLFNSYIFIFLFFPTTLTLYYFLVQSKGRESAIRFLVLSSLFFYGWWNPSFLILIICSVTVNFFVGKQLHHLHSNGQKRKKKFVLIGGVSFNLVLIGWYKYAFFIAQNIAFILSFDPIFEQIILPLGISFFTFQQIAFLIDASRGEVDIIRFSHYSLFVTFFPQLIAGPIVHHKEILPQFLQPKDPSPQLENIIIGITIFGMGLFKKTALADGISKYATHVFDSSLTGEPISFFVAWGGALAYTFQLYFDFSGYSDMAIGIARTFGIHLPLNFASPYKATCIIEFWHRWHITLSRFLRDYLYFTLGGNRKGTVRRYINLFITMLLGGLWHGAGWTFVFWGVLHGMFLTINHLWRQIASLIQFAPRQENRIWRFSCWLLTFISVVNAWVFFRATSFDSALSILQGMYGLNDFAIPNGIAVRLGHLNQILQSIGITTYTGGGSQFLSTYLWIGTLSIIAIMLPNTQEIMKSFTDYQQSNNNTLFNNDRFAYLATFRYSIKWAVFMALILVSALFGITSVSEFLYFQF